MVSLCFCHQFFCQLSVRLVCSLGLAKSAIQTWIPHPLLCFCVSPCYACLNNSRILFRSARRRWRAVRCRARRRRRMMAILVFVTALLLVLVVVVVVRRGGVGRSAALACLMSDARRTSLPLGIDGMATLVIAPRADAAFHILPGERGDSRVIGIRTGREQHARGSRGEKAADYFHGGKMTGHCSRRRARTQRPFCGRQIHARLENDLPPLHQGGPKFHVPTVVFKQWQSYPRKLRSN